MVEYTIAGVCFVVVIHCAWQLFVVEPRQEREEQRAALLRRLEKLCR